MGIEVAAIHVDHKLRGKESAADGTICGKDYVKRMGFRFSAEVSRFQKLSKKTAAMCKLSVGMEDMHFSTEIMKSMIIMFLATAHHAEDQLETVLMQVTKGSQPSGMPVKREIEGGFLIRPFLPAMKADLYSYVEENELQFREDPSNESDAYLRNRFRHQIVPFMLDENP